MITLSDLFMGFVLGAFHKLAHGYLFNKEMLGVMRWHIWLPKAPASKIMRVCLLTRLYYPLHHFRHSWDTCI